MPAIPQKQRGYVIKCRAKTLECTEVECHLPSPVKDETEPDWLIQLHARERGGRPFMNVSMNANARHVCEVLALWLVPWLRAEKLDVHKFGKALGKALEEIARNGAIVQKKFTTKAK